MKGSKYKYWKFEKALDDEMCERILNLAANKFSKAIIDAGDLKTMRDSSVVWLNEPWLYDLVFNYMHSANENSGWNVDIDGAEDMQLTKYKKKGFYSYHSDGSGFNVHNKPNSINLHNKCRKISMTALLNNQFEGGEFEFYNTPKLEMNKGDIVFFPSFELHRVKPVTKGVRHSLVAWFLGNPYR